jgi:ubiquinone/menaquinone biosynthesis C-methylase UbiE
VSSAPVTGNQYDKYGSANPVVRRLMAGFERALDDLLEQACPRSLVDVGCGEGVLTERWAARLDGPVVGVDLDDPGLHAEWAGRAAPNLEFRAMTAERLEFGDGEFDAAAAIEVLEHVRDPDSVLAEMSRVAQRHLLVSVPREPLWRVANVARGAYLRDAGNTPGHVNHWSTRAFVRLAARHGTVAAVRTPFPWTMVLVRLTRNGVRPGFAG